MLKFPSLLFKSGSVVLLANSVIWPLALVVTGYGEKANFIPCVAASLFSAVSFIFLWGIWRYEKTLMEIYSFARQWAQGNWSYEDLGEHSEKRLQTALIAHTADLHALCQSLNEAREQMIIVLQRCERLAGSESEANVQGIVMPKGMQGRFAHVMESMHRLGVRLQEREQLRQQALAYSNQMVVEKISEEGVAQNLNFLEENKKHTAITSEVVKSLGDVAHNISAQASKNQDLMTPIAHHFTQVIEQVKSIHDIVLQLQARREGIAHVAMGNSDVANQMHLLSLNAAIEAAKAGEHGHSFTVVADEVRKMVKKNKDLSDRMTEELVVLDGHINSVVAATQKIGEIVHTAQQDARMAQDPHTQANRYADEVISRTTYLRDACCVMDMRIHHNILKQQAYLALVRSGQLTSAQHVRSERCPVLMSCQSGEMKACFGEVGSFAIFCEMQNSLYQHIGKILYTLRQDWIEQKSLREQLQQDYQQLEIESERWELTLERLFREKHKAW